MSLEGVTGAFIDPEQAAGTMSGEDQAVVGALNPRNFSSFGEYWVAVHAAKEASASVHTTEDVEGDGRPTTSIPESVQDAWWEDINHDIPH
jgi:hypothetical protein